MSVSGLPRIRSPHAQSLANKLYKVNIKDIIYRFYRINNIYSGWGGEGGPEAGSELSLLEDSFEYNNTRRRRFLEPGRQDQRVPGEPGGQPGGGHPSG